MVKKVISYTDYNGEDRTEEAWFNLTEAELVIMEVSAEGNSIELYLQKIIDSIDGGKMMEVFTNLIKNSYGVKSIDGKRFIKHRIDEHGNKIKLADEFCETEAYSVMIMECIKNSEYAASFFNGVLSESIKKKFAALITENPNAVKTLKDKYGEASINNILGS